MAGLPEVRGEGWVPLWAQEGGLPPLLTGAGACGFADFQRGSIMRRMEKARGGRAPSC